MSRSKSRKSVWSRGDREALALIVFAISFILVASLYPNPPWSGGLGQFLRRTLSGNLGLVALASPVFFFAFGIGLLLKNQLSELLKASLGLVLVAGFILPLLSFFKPGAGGQLGDLSAGWILSATGQMGMLLPTLLAFACLDLLRGRIPGQSLYSGLVAVLRGFGQLLQELAGRVKFWLRRSAVSWQLWALERGLAAIAGSSRRAELASLTESLAASSAAAREPDSLDELATTIVSVRNELLNILAEEIAEEGQGLGFDFTQDRLSLQGRILGSDPESRELETIRKLLLAETRSLDSEFKRLAKARVKAADKCQRSEADLAGEVSRHQHRLEAWHSATRRAQELQARLQIFQQRRLGQVSPLDPPASPDWEEPPAQVWVREVRPAAKVEAETSPPPLPPTPEPKPRRRSEPRPQPAPQTPSPAMVADGTTPPLSLLDPPSEPPPAAWGEAARSRMGLIEETLGHFGVQAQVVAAVRGPAVTRYEIEPGPGEKISRISGLSNDLARSLSAGAVRIEAPIPGKNVIGLEVPNAERELVRLSDAMGAAFQKSRDRLPLVLGKSIEGEIWIRDLAKMPHLLIAGATGSGKSVCVNTLITSLVFRYGPEDLRFLMVDPKMVELTPYEGIPHLIRPVITNPGEAAAALLGAVSHMERRYRMLSAAGARNLEQYNSSMRDQGEPTLPYLVIVIDELADLMITSPKEVEQAIMRLAQMARATGMHLVLATQRPSVDILTALIKVNVPARIAFAVASGHDSRTILDSIGAERLTGQGDMLFHQPGLAKPVRLQGPFVSDHEIARVTEYLRGLSFDDQFGSAYGGDFEGPPAPDEAYGDFDSVDLQDPLLRRAALIVIEEGYASVSRLQRRLSVGHARAGKLIDGLEALGIVGPHQGSKSRDVLMGMAEAEAKLAELNLS